MRSEPILVSGSKFQLSEHCKAWTVLEYPEEQQSSAATEGQRKHAVIRASLEGEHPQLEPWLSTVERHCVRNLPSGALHLEIAFAIGADGAVRKLNPKFDRDYSEALPGDLVLTSDLIAVQKDHVHVWDWKTGKHRLGPAADSLQLGAGALAACLFWSRPTATVAYKYVSDSRVTTDEAKLDGGALLSVARRLRTIRELDTEPHPGEHCEALYCPARGVCTAWRVGGGHGVPERKAQKEEKRIMGKMNLKSISKGKETPFCIWVHGKGGVGKTTLATGAPDPVFLAEPDGLRKYPKVDRFPTPENWGDVLEAVDSLAEGGHTFKTFVIDTLDFLELFLRAEITRVKGEFDEDFGRAFKLELPYWLDLRKRLDVLRDRGMNIILTSHSVVKPRKDPTTESFDSWVPSLAPVVTDLWRNWSSALLYAAYEMHAVTEGKGAAKKVRGVSDGARVLYTDERAGFVAKNRYGLPLRLPLEWSDFEKAARAGHAAEPSVLKAAIEDVAATASEKLAADIRAFIAKAGDDATKLEKTLNWAQAMVQQELEAA